MRNTYHVHTEFRPNLARIVERHFDGFTLLRGTGYWQGTSEPAAVIEIATDNARKVRQLARDIKRTNHQSAVLIERLRTESALV